MAPQTTFPDLKGKRVLVTGGSAGIGKATALAFARNGAVVTVLGRRQGRLDAVVTEMGGGHTVTCDLSDNARTVAAVREAIEKMGGLDVVVNNGGVMTQEMWTPGFGGLASAFNLHVISAALIIDTAREELVKNKGCVVNISSIAAQMPFSGMAPYGAAKAAQDYLTHSQAFELAPKGVRVNGIQPGAIDTEIMEEMAEKRGITMDEQRAKAGAWHALQRTGQADEIAYPILFLCSAAASFITGVVLPVDGGALLLYAGNSGMRKDDQKE